MIRTFLQPIREVARVRRRWLWAALAAVALTLSGIQSAIAGVSHYAGYDWTVLESEHFRVHYHDGEQALARQAIAVAEAAHAWLSPLFNWTPAERTNIILTDEYGLSNGWATPVPDNRSAIFVAPPDRLNSLEDHDGWLRTVITHEYVHILHLDKARGFPKVMRNIVGRYPGALPFSVFPNAFQPAWLIEGYATYYETDRQRGAGRGQSSYFDMLMRMEVATGVKPVRQINQPMVSWPGGTARYLYGVNFFNFVAARKGQDKIQKMVETYSNDGIPFRVNANTKDVFRLGQGELWRQYTDYLNDTFKPQLAAIEARGLREGDRLTRHGYSTGEAVPADDGAVYYVRDDWRRRPALMVLRPGATKPKHLATLNDAATIDWHPRAGILASQIEICGNNRVYYDLYRINPRSGWRTRLTHCGRYHFAAWSPQGDAIMAVKMALGRASLVRMDAAGRHPETVWEAGAGEVVSGLDWSPDGTRLVAAVWRTGSGWNIEEFDLAARRWTALTRDAAIDMQPRYSPDGGAILYTSDHGGVYNIRRLQRASGRTETLTNVLGGAFHPAVTDDGKTLVYTGYDAGGFDIYRLALAGDAMPLSPGPPGPSVVVPPAPPAPEGLREHDYSPWSTLRPRWWFPHLAATEQSVELGLMTSGWDVLQRHIYFADLAYDVTNDWPIGSFDYIYDRWYPLFKLHASRLNDFDLNDDDEIERIRHQDTFQAEIVLPWLRINRSLSLHAGAYRYRETDGWVDNDVVEKPEDVDNVAATALVYDSTAHFPRSISRSAGRQISLAAENSDMIEGSDYTGGVYLLDWREFLPLFGEHVLAARLVEGWGTERPRPFELGGSFGAAGVPGLLDSSLVNSPFNQRKHALRGYPTGLGVLEGRRMQLGSLEYRFPIYRLERGITIPPVGLHQFYGNLFVDSGGVWDSDANKPDKYYTGAGVEARADVILFYGALLSLRLGYAHGFDEDKGDDQVYLQLGSAF